MTFYERLLAEELPTGRFGDAPRTQPTTPRRTKPAGAGQYAVANPTSVEQAAEHCRVLVEALDGWEWEAERRADQRRHLHAVRDQNAA